MGFTFHCGVLIEPRLLLIGPIGITKAASHIEGASPWVTGLNLDQWISRLLHAMFNTYTQESDDMLDY